MASRRVATACLAALPLGGTGWTSPEWLFARERPALAADASRLPSLPGDAKEAPAQGTSAGSQAPPTLPRQLPPVELAEDPPQPSPAPIAPPIALPAVPHPSDEWRQPASPGMTPADAPVRFSGVVTNATMGQSGQMSLVITRRGPSGAVTARFHAWGGLVGDGELVGRLEDGRLQASGQLMMGRNPFGCELSGRVEGGMLMGSATFARTGGSWVARGTFALTRS